MTSESAAEPARSRSMTRAAGCSLAAGVSRETFAAGTDTAATTTSACASGASGQPSPVRLPCGCPGNCPRVGVGVGSGSGVGVGSGVGSGVDSREWVDGPPSPAATPTAPGDGQPRPGRGRRTSVSLTAVSFLCSVRRVRSDAVGRCTRLVYVPVGYPAGLPRTGPSNDSNHRGRRIDIVCAHLSHRPRRRSGRSQERLGVGQLYRGG